jgi:multiple sugar transport system ATP-binding protein
MEQPVLEFRDITKLFGAVSAIDGISFSIQSGEIFTLLGPSGCGKTTTLRLVAGLEEPDDGEILVNGVAVAAPRRNVFVAPDKRKLGMVFQSYAIWPHLTVFENVAFPLRVRRESSDVIRQRVQQVLESVGLAGLAERGATQLSGGQQQRVALARALVYAPAVLLLDEPLSNLDAKLRVDMRTEIKRLHQRTGATIVYVTHDQIEAMTLASKIAVLKDGELQQVGTPAEIYNRPANLFVADFMGSPAMNLIKAKVTNGSARKALALSRGESQPLFLPLSGELELAAGDDGREVILGVRPEAITDRDGADRNARAIEILECQVEVVEPAGSDTYVVTHLGGKEVVARMRADADVRPGQTMPFAFNLEKAVLFDPQSGQRL